MADDILIVDDEKDIRSLLSMTLEDEGICHPASGKC